GFPLAGERRALRGWSRAAPHAPTEPHRLQRRRAHPGRVAGRFLGLLPLFRKAGTGGGRGI
ncbi:hypothetical protein H8959_008498, partial [Pygathrix nigripes]